MTTRTTPQSASARLQRAIVVLGTAALVLAGTGLAVAGGAWPKTPESPVAGIRSPLPVVAPASKSSPVDAAAQGAAASPRTAKPKKPAAIVRPSRKQAGSRIAPPPTRPQSVAEPQSGRSGVARPDAEARGDGDRTEGGDKSGRDDDDHETVRPDVRDDHEDGEQPEGEGGHGD